MSIAGRARLSIAKMIDVDGCGQMATTATPISEQERVKREMALVSTIANLRIEDLHLDHESTCIFQRHVDGEITFEEFRAAIDEWNERRFGPVSVSRNGRS